VSWKNTAVPEPGFRPFFAVAAVCRSWRLPHGWACGCPAGGTLLRVLPPLPDPLHYQSWIALAGIFRVLPFGMFLVSFPPMLWQPRVDGLPGQAGNVA